MKKIRTEDVIKLYEENKSIDKTAKLLGTNKIKIRRILITQKLWKSDRSEKIGELHDMGKTTEEISKILEIDLKTVQSYLPYTRGEYAAEPETNDAMRSKIYRTKMKKAEKKQREKEEEIEQMDRERATNTRVNLTFFDDVDKEEKEKSEAKLILRDAGMIDPFEGKGFLSDRFIPDSVYEGEGFTECVKARVSLRMPDGITPSVILNYGKAEKGITRDIVCPLSMDLHTLHFVCQLLFNWQNEHLHAFRLPPSLSDSLTGGSFSSWTGLLGTLFRFPVSSQDAGKITADDDYEPLESIKSWMKDKIKGPYTFISQSEDEDFIRKRLEEFLSSWHIKGIGASPAAASLSDVSGYFSSNPLDLLDCLTLSDILKLTDSLSYFYDEDGSGWICDISFIRSAYLKREQPVCTDADGLPVMEGLTGGVTGYANFLDEIHRPNSYFYDTYDDAESLPAEEYVLKKVARREGRRRQARLKGWTGTRTSPQNIL